jgi:hypothetical protein
MRDARKVHVGVRLPRPLVERIDARVEEWKAALPGMRVTRTDIIQVLLEAGLRHPDGRATGPLSGKRATHE